MADIFCSPSGNDTTGNGTIGNPYLTPSKTESMKTAGDRSVYRAGTYTLTANLSISTNSSVVAYPGETVNFTGSFSINPSATYTTFIKINFQNMGSSTTTTTGFFSLQAAARQITFEDCSFSSSLSAQRYGINIPASMTNVILKNCSFLKTGSGNFYPTGTGTSAAFTVKYCVFSGTHQILLSNTVFITADSNQCINMTNGFLETSVSFSPATSFLSAINNNFINTSMFYMNSGSAGTTDFNNTHIYRNVYTAQPVINNASVRVLSLSSGYNDQNVIVSGVSTTNFTNTNSINPANLAACQFYNSGAGDYRIDINSPLHLGAGEVCGAYAVDPDGFYDSLADSDVRAGVSFKRRSLTPNGLGTFTGSGGGSLSFQQKLLFIENSFQFNKKIRLGQYDTRLCALSSGDTVETYTYKLSGATVLTMTITYTDNTRTVPSHIVYS